MKTSSLPSLDRLPAAEALRVEELCTRFETVWKEASPPRLEDFLPGKEWLSASVLFCELLRLELEYRRRRGEQPAMREYLPRFTGQEALIDQVFAAVGMTNNPAGLDTITFVPAPKTGVEGTTSNGAGVAVIAGYELLGSLGQGSMGTVFRARQLSAHRMVALKVIRADRLRDLPNDAERQRWIDRFQWEVQAVARLDHPHIVPLYEVGEHEGQPYFSMKLVEGDSLVNGADRFLREPRATAQLMAKVARALHHAHQRQILHRDLKPHNILIDRQGQPLVTDFGLALRIEPTSQDPSTTEGIAGTPAYMAPEQARADRELTTAVDVYGLGAVLYHLLTGRPPHRGESANETLCAVRLQEPQTPRSLNAHADRDLEAVCLKCLSKEPAKRYRSADEVADDLERWLRGEPVRAQPAGPAVRLHKWIRRRPGFAAAWACALTALLAAAFFAYQDNRNRAERLQLAIDRAIAAALGDDLELSGKAIHDAELQGASTGQVRFLRGLVSLQQSDAKTASDELEPAADLLPDSVAVRALLAIFHFRAGRWAKHDHRMKEMAAMTASSPEDFLFKGYQESFTDPELALRTLDSAVRLRNTGIARAIRAESLARYALDRTDFVKADQARKDATVAKELLPSNPFVLSANVQAHLVAAILHDEKDSREEKLAALNAIEADVQWLTEKHIRHPWVGAHGAKFHELIGKPDQALQVLERAADKSQNNPAVFDLAAERYRRGEIKRALQVLDQKEEGEDSELDRLRVFLTHESEGRTKAEGAIAKWLDRYREPENLGDAVPMWLFLRQTDKARDVAKGVALLNWPSSARREYDAKSKAFSSGKGEPEELLKAAAWSRSCRCSAHFLIGMTYLADGEQPKARTHLRHAVATKDYFNNDFILSRAILARLERPID